MEELYLMTFAIVKESIEIAEAPARKSDALEIQALKRILSLKKKLRRIRQEIIGGREVSDCASN